MRLRFVLLKISTSGCDSDDAAGLKLDITDSLYDVESPNEQPVPTPFTRGEATIKNAYDLNGEMGPLFSSSYVGQTPSPLLPVASSFFLWVVHDRQCCFRYNRTGYRKPAVTYSRRRNKNFFLPCSPYRDLPGPPRPIVRPGAASPF